MAVAAVVLAAVFSAVIFVLRPNLDVDTANLFYRQSGAFMARGWLANFLRRIADWSPLVIAWIMVAAFVARRLGGLAFVPAPGWRGIALVIGSLLVGPAILVNAGLKDHSHRPRPAHLTTFGGKAKFRPFYRFDGDCGTNCSFVSGEVATAAWTLAPALLVPVRIVPSARALAVVASVTFAGAVAILRMAAGGHFLSDVVFAVLLTWFVVLALYRLLYSPPDTRRRVPDDALHVGWPNV